MKKMKAQKRNLWFVGVSIVLAVLVGSFLHDSSFLYKNAITGVFKVGGELFLNALTLIVAPLVASSIISGMVRAGSEKNFSTLGAKTFGFYIGTSLAAVLIGVFLANIFQPGASQSLENFQNLQHSSLDSLAPFQNDSEFWHNISKIFTNLVPSNIIDAFGKNDMLGIIFFSIIFGFAISQIPEKKAEIVGNFFKGIFHTMLKFTQIIMKTLPIGVFFLVAGEFAKTGFGALKPVAYFVLVVLLALFLYACVLLPLLLKFIGKVNPFWHVKAMFPAIMTAFSTSSSSATIPITMECVEKRAKVSNHITSLVVPLGSSINMAGSALYESVAALFIAQVYGLEITIVQQILVIVLALLTSIGIAGVPSASLVVIIIVLKTIGLPTEAVGLVVAVDRLLDMCRTVVNIFSDSCCAVLVARTEGEENVLQTDPSEIKDAI
ncbi:MAG: dicarboxylate/amino acid:cation symporter [Rhabdochlamydiaceae bacterium]|nr:dicarboxylate/amino acid:cation symporter [Candidatus Amphrikana amoebophyrae]